MPNPWMSPYEQQLQVYRDNYATESYRVQMYAETEEDLERIQKRLLGSGASPSLLEEINAMLKRVKYARELTQQDVEQAQAKIEEVVVTKLLEQKGMTQEMIAQQAGISLKRVQQIVNSFNIRYEEE